VTAIRSDRDEVNLVGMVSTGIARRSNFRWGPRQRIPSGPAGFPACTTGRI